MKYMGSKNRVSKEILSIILKGRKDGQHYIEPFCGGCNVVDKINDSLCWANDINEYLIEMFIALQNGWIPPKEISRDEYAKIKENKGKYAKYLVGYVGFNCSYSGKWFGGYAGKTKTKEGMRDYQEEAFRNIMKQSKDISNVKFLNVPYDEILYPMNSLIYFDPPYENTTKYKDKFNHKEFWDFVRYLEKDGHTVFVSEYNAPDDFECVWEKGVSSSLSANGISGQNKRSVERLFRLKKFVLAEKGVEE